MKNNLYFVENIISVDYENRMFQVALSKTEKDETVFRVIDVNREQLMIHNHSTEIREGWYIYYNETNVTKPFSNANFDRYAVEQIHENRRLREALLEYQDESYSIELLRARTRFLNTNEIEVYSYHINVGHGNCSLILSVEKNPKKNNNYWLTMIDCSDYDYTNKKTYKSNIEDCFDEIARKLNIKKEEIRINLFLLTHFHYDHCSGMEYLVKSGYINHDTIIYMNLHYQMASETVNRVLTCLINIKATIIEPINTNSKNTSFMEILYPECSIFKSKSHAPKACVNCRAESKVNNSSVVYMLRLGNKTMVCPGDLEIEGFKRMTKIALCSPFLNRANYYAISHHGSINGHPDMSCARQKQVLQCLTSGLDMAFVMGRNGAFKGIYSPVVIGYFSKSPNKNKLYFTEYDSNNKNFPVRYFELEWASSVVTYH
jgi:beta-lactamase superfamily II metal-dependent hydrolase